MMKITACIITLIAVSLAIAEDFIEVLPGYQVVGVLDFSDQPTEIIVLRIDDGSLFQARVGSQLDAYHVSRISTEEGRANTEFRLDGKRYKVAMKSAPPTRFRSPVMQSAFEDGYIDKDGKVTQLGRAAIRSNLAVIAEAGFFYMARTGKPAIDYNRLEPHLADLVQTRAPSDPFAPPSRRKPVIQAISSITGESYADIVMSRDGGQISVTTPCGVTVSRGYRSSI